MSFSAPPISLTLKETNNKRTRREKKEKERVKKKREKKKKKVHKDKQSLHSLIKPYYKCRLSTIKSEHTHTHITT